jgi:tRNA 5-methylaminomethyl-2-thiouridine biosynthesis bifunctional protein
LVEQYPEPIAGCHRLHFDNVTLDLWFGDVLDVYSQLPHSPDGLVDAWFLDGFAPNKNPDMWVPELFSSMAQLCRNSATLATFTAAGLVKRGLLEAGFAVTKIKGYGRKREMITANFSRANASQAPWQGTLPYFVRYAQPNVHTVRIVGGGIAAAALAFYACKAGLNVAVYCKDAEFAQGASGNVAGGVYPQLTSDISHASLIQAHCFSYATRFYRQLATQQEFAHDLCGVLLLAHSDTVAKRQAQLRDKGNWPETMISAVDSQCASDIAGVDLTQGGLFLPDGGWVDPREVTAALWRYVQAHGNLEMHMQHEVDAQTIATWQHTPHTVTLLALGHHSPLLQAIAPLPYRLVRGQIEHVPATADSANLRVVLCHKGYFTPAHQGLHALGSTYVKEDTELTWRESESVQNWHTHQQALADNAWFSSLTDAQQGRASVRCSTPDHQPLMGQLPNINAQTEQYAELYKALRPSSYPFSANIPNTYMLTGLGSRGLTTAPLLAATLIAQITQAPLPLAQPLLDALQPNRFLIRNLIRQQSYTP